MMTLKLSLLCLQGLILALQMYCGSERGKELNDRLKGFAIWGVVPNFMVLWLLLFIN